MGFKQFKPPEWCDELSRAGEFRKRFGLEKHWTDLEDIYNNVHKSMMNDGPNIIMSTADSLMSSLTVPNPRVMVKPWIPEAVDKAPLVETLDNVIFQECEIKSEGETAALHAFIFGRGFIKCGFDSEFGYNPRYDVGGSLKMGFTLTQLDRKGQRRIEHDSNIWPGMPWCRAVDPHDMFLPWGTKHIQKCPWIGQRIIRHIDDLKADAKYENLNKVQPTLSMESLSQSYRSPVKPSGFSVASGRGKEFVEFYEIQDRRTGRIMCIVDGNEKFIRNEPNALQIDNVLPFASISLLPVVRAFWMTPYAYYIRYAQAELSDISVQRSKQRRISTIKFLYDEGVISEDELEKLLSPDVGVAAKIDAGGDITKAILALQHTPNDFLLREEEVIRQNAREQIGFSRNQLGEYTGGRKTATEASIVNQWVSRRLSRPELALKKFYGDVIEIINGIIFEHWTRPRYVQTIGAAQTDEWIAVRGTDLKSRYSYEINFTDDQELQARHQQAMQIYMMMSQDPSVDPVALRQYLVNNYNVPEFGRLFNANIQNAMRVLRMLGGALPKNVNGQNGQGMALPLQGQNGKSSGQLPDLNRLLPLGGGNSRTS